MAAPIPCKFGSRAVFSSEEARDKVFQSVTWYIGYLVLKLLDTIIFLVQQVIWKNRLLAKIGYLVIKLLGT